mgnify:CR=1 FL=1
MSEKILQVPGIIESPHFLKDKSVKFTVHTQELPPEQAAILAALNQSFGWRRFKESEWTESQLADMALPAIDKPAGEKHKSQVLRGVLYHVWKQSPYSKTMTSDQFYHYEMQRIIDHYKEKLN